MHRYAIALCSYVAATGLNLAHAAPFDEAFTYQGRVQNNGAPLDQAADIRFELVDEFNVLVPGAAAIVVPYTPTPDGLFTAELNFGIAPFEEGEERYLRIGVRVPPGGGAFTTLSPNQRISPTPYALFSTRPWQTDGDDIFFDGTFVGIGTSTPSSRLDVRTTTGRAVFGLATAPNGDNYGVLGQSASNNGAGVFGFATADTGSSSGVLGFADSATGRGVYGFALDSTGVNYGVYGETNSDNGWAGYFEGRGRFTDDLGIGTSPNARLNVRRQVPDTRPAMVVQTEIVSGPGLDVLSLAFEGSSIDASSLAAGSQPIRLNPNTGGDILLGLGGGRVGVNTVAPDGKMHVVGAGNASPAGGGIVVIEHGPSGNQLAFDGNEVQARSGGNASDLVINAGGGNVGIGTTSPDTTLHVQGSNDGTDVLVTDSEFARMRMVATDPASDVTLTVQARGSANAPRAEIGTVSSHDVVLFSNGSVRIRIDSDGSVCIGGGC